MTELRSKSLTCWCHGLDRDTRVILFGQPLISPQSDSLPFDGRFSIFCFKLSSDISQFLVPKKRPQSLDIIRLRNAVFYAYHGVLSDEQNLGGKFEVDVDLHCSLSRAAVSDSLKQTVDYERVYDSIKGLVLGKKYYLIEALARTIADGILKDFRAVQKVVVRVRKPGAAVKGVIDHVEVEIFRERS